MALVLFLFGIVSGVGLGDELSRRCVTKREYGLANAGVLLVGALASSVVLVTGLSVLMGLVIGLMAGAVAGLKLGFGESVGPWKFADKYFNVNKGQVGRSEAEKARGRAARKARREGEPEPELMSVQMDGPNSASGTNAKKGTRH